MHSHGATEDSAFGDKRKMVNFQLAPRFVRVWGSKQHPTRGMKEVRLCESDYEIHDLGHRRRGRYSRTDPIQPLQRGVSRRVCDVGRGGARDVEEPHA